MLPLGAVINDCDFSTTKAVSLSEPTATVLLSLRNGMWVQYQMDEVIPFSVNAVLLGFDRDEDIVAGRLERATW